MPVSPPRPRRLSPSRPRPRPRPRPASRPVVPANHVPSQFDRSHDMAPSPQIAKLNDENYSEWAIGMKALLVRRSLFDVVSGAYPCPMGSLNSKVVKSWTAKNSEAHAELILYIEPSQYAHINSEVAAEFWIALRDVHLSRGFGTALTRHRTFWTMTKRDDQPMSAWVADVRRAAFRLRDINAHVTDDDIIIALTNGLPPSYTQLIVTLDSAPASDLTVNNVVTRLLNEETRQLSVSGPLAGAPDSTLAADAKLKPRTPIERITCFKCGKKGHYQRDCAEQKAEANTVEAW